MEWIKYIYHIYLAKQNEIEYGTGYELCPV